MAQPQVARANECVVAYNPCGFIVIFEPGSAELRWGAIQTLSKFVTSCKEAYDGDLVLTGHSDPNGTPQANKALSLARAEAVRAFLLSSGLRPRLIEIVGYGASRPLVQRRPGDPKHNEMADQQNRRVELNAKF